MSESKRPVNVLLCAWNTAGRFLSHYSLLSSVVNVILLPLGNSKLSLHPKKFAAPIRSDTEKLSFWNLLLKACGEILKASASSLCVVPVSASKALTFVPIKSASLLKLNQPKSRIKETAKRIKAFIIFVRPRKWLFRLPFLHGLHSQPRTWRRIAE
nr:MAG TPA: hypothetical protein [Caudoviricetes sp.]